MLEFEITPENVDLHQLRWLQVQQSPCHVHLCRLPVHQTAAILIQSASSTVLTGAMHRLGAQNAPLSWEHAKKWTSDKAV